MPPLLDLCHSLDPVSFARERLRFLPTPPSPSSSPPLQPQVILNCTRQWGKSTLTAAQAVFTARHEPEILILVMSPTARQSSELVRKAAIFLSRLGSAPRRWRQQDFAPVAQRSRIVGLPRYRSHRPAASPASASFSSTKPPASTMTSTSPCSPSSPSAAAISGS